LNKTLFPSIIKRVIIRKLLSVLTLILLISLLANAEDVKVRGYYRSDGTYVRPHYRSKPDGNPYNNWSYPNNINPYTGRIAVGKPSTYLFHYCKKSPNNKYCRSYNLNSVQSSEKITDSQKGVSSKRITNTEKDEVVKYDPYKNEDYCKIIKKYKYRIERDKILSICKEYMTLENCNLCLTK